MTGGGIELDGEGGNSPFEPQPFEAAGGRGTAFEPQPFEAAGGRGTAATGISSRSA